MAAGERCSLFPNEYRTPLHAKDAAQALVEFVANPDGPNVFHLPGPERVSRWQLAQRLVAAQGLSVEALESTERQDPLRPRDVSLLGAWCAMRRTRHRSAPDVARGTRGQIEMMLRR